MHAYPGAGCRVYRPGHAIGRPVIRGRYFQQVANYVDDARDYLARRTDELADRRTTLADRGAQLRGRERSGREDVVAAAQAAADGLAHAIAAHRRTATQHERTAIAHERCADLLDEHHAADRAVHHRQAAAVERDAAERSRAEADRAEREEASARAAARATLDAGEPSTLTGRSSGPETTKRALP